MKQVKTSIVISIAAFIVTLLNNRIFAQHVNRIVKHSTVSHVTQHENRDTAQHDSRELAHNRIANGNTRKKNSGIIGSS